jgi:hypothetical protein
MNNEMFLKQSTGYKRLPKTQYKLNKYLNNYYGAT